MRRVVSIFESSYGTNHPDVSTALQNLSTLLCNLNHRKEAEPLARRALAIVERSLGKNHHAVATSLNNLAVLLYSLERLAEAEPLMRRSIDILLDVSRQTAREHPHLQANVRNYRSILLRMGKSKETARKKIKAILGGYRLRSG